MKTFEEWLQDICPCHTNNSPEGFEKWLESLDKEDLIKFADGYGDYCIMKGRLGILKGTNLIN